MSEKAIKAACRAYEASLCMDLVGPMEAAISAYLAEIGKDDGLLREIIAQADYERTHGGKIVTVGLLRSAAARIVELEAQIAKAGEDTWQPIETAPKDGTDLLCFIPGLGMGQMVLYWLDGHWREKANNMGLKTEPACWMPLPALKRTGQEGKCDEP